MGVMGKIVNNFYLIFSANRIKTAPNTFKVFKRDSAVFKANALLAGGCYCPGKLILKGTPSISKVEQKPSILIFVASFKEKVKEPLPISSKSV